jgi:hypothetical protein
MPKTKNSKTKELTQPQQHTRSPEEEVDEVKTKDRPIEIPEDDEKVVDPDAVVEDEATTDDDPAGEDAGLDVEEIDPFGDKWEQ